MKKKLAALPEIPNKRYFPIREASDLCGVKDYVLRFWEKEFSQLRPLKRGAHRAYRKKDIEIARRIRELVHGEGYKLSAARQILTQELEALKNNKPIQEPEAPAELKISREAVTADIGELEEIISNLEKIVDFLHT